MINPSSSSELVVDRVRPGRSLTRARRRRDPLARAHPHGCALAHALAQVIELGAANVAASGDLHALDLWRMQGKRALHAHAEGLLAHGECLACAVALALDHDALEDLYAPARALDDL